MFATLYLTYTISIHVLREEDDALKICRQLRVTISIHVLREEDDMHPATPSAARCYFYPRPPRGGRPWSLASGEWSN